MLSAASWLFLIVGDAPSIFIEFLFPSTQAVPYFIVGPGGVFRIRYTFTLWAENPWVAGQGVGRVRPEGGWPAGPSGRVRQALTIPY
jgi:hypothetical protein